MRKRPADLASHLRAFLQQQRVGGARRVTMRAEAARVPLRRKRQRGRGQRHDPNDRGYDRTVEARPRLLDPEVLDRLLRDEVES